ncbi:MAG: rhodanese-like domain-containing protein, partial [Aquificaceae bacterium]|nr:rhodanese-like domain-containing protein [Aquificaceae bacterium]
MDIKPEELYQLEDKVLVDIRSPSEYRDFHIPGALNVPLFEDQEKRLIGLIYRGEGLE